MSSSEEVLLCRLCAESFAKDISNKINKSINVIEKIYQYFQISITENDVLPKNVCYNCYQKVFDIYKFHQQITNAQNILQAKLIIKCEEADVKSEDIASYDSWFYDDEEPLSNHIVDKTELKDDSALVEKKNVNNKTLCVLKANNELRKYYWKCFECEDKIFKTIEKLKLHFEDIHCETPVQYVCLKCSENFHTIDQLQLHIREQQHSIHNDQSVIQVGDKYVCDTCKKEFSSRKNILVHRFIHLGIKRYSCNECGKSFMQRPHLKNHMAIHSDATPFNCTQCQKKFKTKDNLRIHMRSHVPKETRLKFECDVCQKKFTSTSNLNYHKKIHSGIPEFTCEYCGKRFLHKGNLQEHTLIHSTEVGSYHCEQCPKTFKNISRLRQHQLRFHSHTKPHKCDICEKKFRIKSELIEHKRIHSGELPFECDFCTKKFRLKKTLKIHLRQHTGEKPYYCTNCNHHFTNSSNYNKHLKIRHGGVSAENNVPITSSIKSNILISSL